MLQLPESRPSLNQGRKKRERRASASTSTASAAGSQSGKGWDSVAQHRVAGCTEEKAGRWRGGSQWGWGVHACACEHVFPTAGEERASWSRALLALAIAISELHRSFYCTPTQWSKESWGASRKRVNLNLIWWNQWVVMCVGAARSGGMMRSEAHPKHCRLAPTPLTRPVWLIPMAPADAWCIFFDNRGFKVRGAPVWHVIQVEGSAHHGLKILKTLADRRPCARRENPQDKKESLFLSNLILFSSF